MMFKLIWSAVLGGNPTSWAIMGLGAVLLLGGAFGVGYATGAQSTIKTVVGVTAAAPAKAASAQKTADDKDRKRGAEAGAAKDTRDAAANTKLSEIERKLDALSKSIKDCVVPQASVELLNEAGQ